MWILRNKLINNNKEVRIINEFFVRENKLEYYNYEKRKKYLIYYGMTFIRIL